MNKIVLIQNLGRMEYLETWKLQIKFAQEIYNNVKNNKKPEHKLLFVEHYPVYTTGIRTENYSKEEEKHLRNLGAQFYRTNRGGLITFHGPGQLTVYPILYLKAFGKGIRWYVSSLERTVIKCLHNFNIHSQTSSETGIWINDRKICAIGIQGRHVTTHGLALNCNTDLTWFDHIIPCGIQGKSVTSVSKELGSNTTIKDVLPFFVKSFTDVFEASIEENE